MPLSLDVHPKRSISPFLDGLITDNDTARKAIADRFGVSPNNSFAILSHIGKDVAGALQILPEGSESTDAAQNRGEYIELTKSEVAEQPAAAKEEYREGRSPVE